MLSKGIIPVSTSLGVCFISTTDVGVIVSAVVLSELILVGNNWAEVVDTETGASSIVVPHFTRLLISLLNLLLIRATNSSDNS